MNSFKKTIHYTSIGAISSVISKINGGRGKRYMVDSLVSLPGIPGKMGQFLRMKFDKEGAGNVSPRQIPLGEIKLILEQEIPNFIKDLAEISSDGITASLGQVHKVSMKDGSNVAVKIKYPGIDNEIGDQLELMVIILFKAPIVKKSGIDVEAYKVFFQEYLTEELNYLIEAKSQNSFKETWRNDKNIIIPSIYPQYSTSSILVQSYESSIRLQEIKSMPPEVRRNCGIQLTKFFWKSVLEYGLVHTDLQPQNWGYKVDENRLVVYDFGATLSFGEDIRGELLKLITHNLTNIEYMEVLINLGFNPVHLSKIADKISELINIITLPLVQDKEWNIKEWDIQGKMDTLLGPESWSFRAAGPPWFILLMRSYYGWLYALKELDVNLNYSHFISFKRGKGKIIESENVQLSTKLKVNVFESGMEIVAVDLPVAAIENIEDLIPDHVLCQLKNNKISLDSIRASVMNSGFCAQEVFKAKVGDRTYRVWIE